MIHRGTTPTIKYTFSSVLVSDIAECYLTVAQDGKTLFEKELSDATIGEDYLSWTLTQEETLQFKIGGRVQMQIRYKLNDGSAYASKIVEDSVYKVLKEGAI